MGQGRFGPASQFVNPSVAAAPRHLTQRRLWGSAVSYSCAASQKAPLVLGELSALAD